MMNVFGVFRLAALCLSFCFCTGWTDQTLIYQALLEGVATQTKWIISEGQSMVKISGKNRGNDIDLEYSPAFSLIHYTEKELKESPFEIRLNGSELEVLNKGKNKLLKLGKYPWIQEFKFGFRPFLQSSDKELAFSIVYSKDTSLHEMLATKELIETLKIEGTEHSAQKIKVTLKGFKKRFWKAEIWYDIATFRMLKYRSNEGPGTPFVEVTLIQED